MTLPKTSVPMKLDCQCDWGGMLAGRIKECGEVGIRGDGEERFMIVRVKGAMIEGEEVGGT